MTTLAASDRRVLMEALQTRIATLDKLIAQESQRRWTVEGVFRADRALLTDALMRLAAEVSNQDRSRADG